MSRSGKRVAGVLVALITGVCVAAFFIPAFIIRPFRYQSPDALSLAIRVKNIAPPLAMVAFLVLIPLVVKMWRGSSRLIRAGLAIAVLFSGASAVMTRLNYFEWMFRPIQGAGFISAREAKLSDYEMVMAVRVGEESRAYPIRQMAYHHVLNDSIAGMPVVVTY